MAKTQYAIYRKKDGFYTGKAWTLCAIHAKKYPTKVAARAVVSRLNDAEVVEVEP